MPGQVAELVFTGADSCSEQRTVIIAGPAPGRMHSQAAETLTAQIRTGAGIVAGAGGLWGGLFVPTLCPIMRASVNTGKTPCVLDSPGQAL